MSATYVCSKCHAEMFSKCFRQRSEFMSNRKVAMLSNALYPIKIEADKGPAKPTDFQKENFQPCYWDFTFRIYMGDTPSEEVLNRMFNTIRDMTEEEQRQVLCRHDWVCIADCMFGCCKKKADPRKSK